MVTAIRNYPGTVKLSQTELPQNKELVRRFNLEEFNQIAHDLPDDRIEALLFRPEERAHRKRKRAAAAQGINRSARASP